MTICLIKNKGYWVQGILSVSVDPITFVLNYCRVLIKIKSVQKIHRLFIKSSETFDRALYKQKAHSKSNTIKRIQNGFFIYHCLKNKSSYPAGGRIGTFVIISLIPQLGEILSIRLIITNQKSLSSPPFIHYFLIAKKPPIRLIKPITSSSEATA